MAEQIPLGVLKKVENTGQKSNLEAKTLYVGFVKVGGNLRAIALTQAELSRPIQRAEKNKEDLPTLEVHEVDEAKLKDEIEGLEKEVDRLKNRGFFARLLNR